ncbi:hypothetical protein V6N11_024410 [Hibiscus sabdariffa]|uniref:DUF4283 domain-containing protein n=1 Tax=Hibiscus sabdariffa TaxID=183260 RepID=A0ABR2NF25_9ROSI
MQAGMTMDCRANVDSGKKPISCRAMHAWELRYKIEVLTKAKLHQQRVEVIKEKVNLKGQGLVNNSQEGYTYKYHWPERIRKNKLYGKYRTTLIISPVNMSISEITTMMDNIKFTKEENDILKDVGPEPQNIEGLEKWLVGRLFNTKPIDTDAVTRVVRRVFTENKLEEMIALDKSLFLMKFLQLEGKKEILNRSPWVFDDDLFAIHDFKPELNISEYRFEKFQIWVRVFGIPLGMMSKQLGGRLGNLMGSFMAIDMREGDGSWGSS